MAGMCELYGKEISDITMNIYYEIFKGYAIDQFKEAVMDVIKVHKYNSLPNPAEILEILKQQKSNSRHIPNVMDHAFEIPSKQDQEKVRKMISDTVKCL